MTRIPFRDRLAAAKEYAIKDPKKGDWDGTFKDTDNGMVFSGMNRAERRQLAKSTRKKGR